ncbi:tripartite tricarboxylate transporter TctB family protein [Ferrovibrio terrae]|uniref:tripartite tricarboxylate transporter TctB family protein n=1 Tax=Ferrovibrio terrae TaxID=2594003 RepID=UPI0031379A8B
MTREATAGAVILLAGGVLLALTWSYPSGDLSEIGPGLILQLASGLLLLLGGLMLGRGIAGRSDEMARVPAQHRWRPFVIPAAMGMFAALLPWLGLALTAAVSSYAASLASRELSQRERLACALLLAAFVTALFGYGLRLPVPVWPRLAA